MMTAPVLSDRALALILTLVIEAAGMGAFTLLWPQQRTHFARNVLLTSGMNVVTHTVFWYTLPLLPVHGLGALCGYEMVIIFVEGLIYAAVCDLPPAVALVLSLGLNLASYMLGTLVWGALF